MAVVITRLDLSAADLREAAARTDDAKASRRMLAIALVLDGWSREAAAEACAMDRQTLRDWVQRYNGSGLEGLSNRSRRNGPHPRLSAEQRAEVAKWVEQGAGVDAAEAEAVADRVIHLQWPTFVCDKEPAPSALPANTPSSGPADRPKTPPLHRAGASPPVNPFQLAGLRAMTIHVAPSIITDRSPGQPAKAARTAAEARARMSSG
jgi:transposase